MSRTTIKPWDIDTVGAASGDAIVLNPTTGEYGPGNANVDTTAEAERIRDVIGAALVQGTGITITVDDAGNTITIAASGGTAGAELLMADSVTSPPVPIETEAGDDWLYQD